ncbi:hypothetical protein EZL74_02895 [Flavobacterium silvisoli]|uniref:Uncharacterized protein n=1 Tax=Flavobacterium silvisoli TaxID=2529433 RepID=A0A4Q9Z8Z4_9FLAO|nr:hypothetical protein [Flavobacterium silvisoli]TBX70637.1 hypothetical protein EZL74_02895 [Flavobacterium silvisoli]
MKKSLLIVAVVLTTIPFIRCSSSDDSSTNNGAINHEQIYGWWYPNANTSIVHYKAYYFGADGVYKQDQTNFNLGMGTGTWQWIGDSIIKMTPDLNGGIAGGAVTGRVFKLSQDSLVFASQGLRLAKNTN